MTEAPPVAIWSAMDRLARQAPHLDTALAELRTASKAFRSAYAGVLEAAGPQPGPSTQSYLRSLAETLSIVSLALDEAEGGPTCRLRSIEDVTNRAAQFFSREIRKVQTNDDRS